MAGEAAEQVRPDGGDQARRYSAFISYSHADAAFAKRLHRQLETYRLPHRALARADGAALAGARLKPVFRDIDELTAAHDLTAAVREAIAQSDHLIVVCSPNAADSLWVAKEIELFRSLHGEAGMLAVIAEGEPAAAFPEALRGGGLEPLAADFRGDASDRRLALLKLVAVLAGVRLDSLIHRDGQRRVRSLGIAAAASVAIVSVVAGLSLAAFKAEREANLQRARAGNLGEFMLSDLRKGLQAAGRHDLLAQVDKAAVSSLNADVSHLTPDQLIQRAKALQAAGEDSEKKGDLKAAHADFDAALKTTAALLAAKPNDPKRIFAHAQSQYWIGFINRREGNGDAARSGYEAYARLSERLVAIDPANDAWRKERAYAAGDLGGLALRQAGDPALAERYFRAALADLDTINQHTPSDMDVPRERAKGLGWLADAQRLQGHLQQADATRVQQRQILAQQLKVNPRDIGVKAQLLFNELAIARIALANGETARALSLLDSGRKHAIELEAQDPDNKDFPKQQRMFELFRVRLWLGMPAAKRPPTETISDVLGDCHVRGPGSDNLEISDFCNVLLARLRSSLGDAPGAAAALASVRQHAAARHELLTARWGLNLADESRPVQLADVRGGAR